MAEHGHNPGDPQRSDVGAERKFRVLLEAHLDGTLNDTGLAQLEQMLAEEPALRRVFVEVCLQDQSARRLFAPTEAAVLPVFSDEDTTEIETHEESSIMATLVDDALRARRLQEVKEQADLQFTRSREKETRWSERRAQALRDQQAGRLTRVPGWAVWGSMAALILLGVWLGMVWSGGGNDDVPLVEDDTAAPVESINVAFLGDTVDADWEGSARRSFYFRADEAVTLSSGLAQVRFRDGATVVVQGPATFEATGTNGLRLVSGRITARIPESAIGFRVETAGGLVTDHGTEFGVWVDAAGRTMAQTFSGRISLAPPDGAGGWRADAEVQLLAGDAASSDATAQRVRVAEPDAVAFVREVEFEAIRDADGSGYARWLAHSYELRRDPSVVAYYVFDEEDARQGRLVNQAQDAGDTHGRLGNGAEIATPRWVAGRFEQSRALRFGHLSDGRTYGVVVPDGDALDLDGEMTFALWVRATDPAEFYGTLLSKREVPPQRMNYQVSIVPGQSFQLGAGRDDAALAGFHYSPALPRLAAPGWHHIVVSADGQTVRFYLNGDVVHTQRQNLPPLANDAALLIGTNAVGGGVSFFDTAISFQGDIGEVLIADRAFDDAEIRSLYANSRGDH